MADYKYEAETIRIIELSGAIKAISEYVDEFSYEIETEDVLKLQRQLKNAVKTADRIVEHLSSLNTKEDREAYIKAQKQKEQAEKVAVLLQSNNVLEYHSMNAAGITNDDIVAFQEYYNVRLREQGYGTWRWLSVHDIEGNHLSGEDFVKIGIRTEQNMADKIIEKAVQTVKSKESVNPYDNYGWVRPDGSFIPSDYGTHEESAIKIVKEMGWMKERRNSVYDLCRDFLVYVKGYVLIHNPSMDGGYIVQCNENHFIASNTSKMHYITHNPAKDLTKAQRTTLFDYFTYNNDSFLANRYGIDEEEMEK